MAKKGSLFRLIKSLTKAEKRYFRLFAQMSGKNKNYLRLFDVIDEMEEYDEAAIKERFKKEKFAQQLHVTKNYLQKLILKSLRNYHARLSKDAELKDLIREVEILHKKELTDSCLDALNRAEKMAIQYQKLPVLLEIIAWKRRLTLGRKVAKQKVIPPAIIIQEEAEALDKIKRQHQLWALNLNLLDQFGKENRGEKQALPQIPIDDPIQTQSLRLYYKQTHHFMIRDIEGAFDIARQLVETLESRQDLIQDDPASYITALNNLMGLCLHLKAYDHIPPLIDKIQQLPQTLKLKPQNPGVLSLLLHTYNIELELYRDTAQYSKGIERTRQINETIKSYTDQIPPHYQLLLNYQYAYLHFMNQQYKEALIFINRIFDLKADGLRSDILGFARLLNLMTHFELGNIMVLKYAIDSSRRFLKKIKRFGPFERMLLSFFSRLTQSPKSEFPQLMCKLDQQLSQHQPKQQIDQALDYLNIREWLHSKGLQVGELNKFG